MRKILRFVCAAFLIFGALAAWADDEKFEITSFDVRGNTLLAKGEVTQLVAPFTGKERVYGDIQRGLEALEAAYRAKGFGTVTVYVPEQELKGGVVVLQVSEAVVGKIIVNGNQFYSSENIRASLPLLQEGKAPNLSAISDNVQLANENPSKHVELTLGVSEEEGKIDAKIGVSDEKVRKTYITMDNSGDKDGTGQYRLGVSYRDANLFGHDEVMTLGYITAPDAPGGVHVDVFTAGLRVPFYSLGDSLDVIIASSSVNIPSSVITPGGLGGLDLNGKGTVLAVRWNHLFPREGEYSSRLVLGYDYKWQDGTTRCPPGSYNSTCVSLLETPISATYLGQWQKPNIAADFNLGAVYNLPLFGHQDSWRYKYAANTRATDTNFLIFKGGGSFLRSFAGDWQVKGILNSQLSAQPLPTTDQFSLAGSSAVRGFGERVLTSDSGFVANIEGYTPDLVPLVGSWLKREFSGTLRALVFYDQGYGWSRPKDSELWADPFNNPAILAGTKPLNERTNISSIGFGLRYAMGKDVSAKFDWARILESSPASRQTPLQSIDDQWRAHFSVIYGF